MFSPTNQSAQVIACAPVMLNVLITPKLLQWTATTSCFCFNCWQCETYKRPLFEKENKKFQQVSGETNTHILNINWLCF